MDGHLTHDNELIVKGRFTAWSKVPSEESGGIAALFYGRAIVCNTCPASIPLVSTCSITITVQWAEWEAQKLPDRTVVFMG